MASICRCCDCTESTGMSARSKRSQMPSAISAAMPCPLGGISCNS
ncbi:Uncharacterised protein [Bordetella pertussis]|nr:Uncharacterised protein [Bordetella pertussis]CPN61747.1 Uncharacterised protein [Bordetella pertussis]